MQPTCSPVAMRRMRGVTLIELMITIVLMAVMLSMAVPGLQGLMTRNQLLGQADEFAGALALARSEAARRGQQTGVCASADGIACSDDPADWNRNLLVFVDIDSGSDLDTGEPVLKSFSAHSDVRQDADVSGVFYSAAGFSSMAAVTEIDICHSDLYAHDKCRRVTIQPSGSVTVRTVQVGS